MQPIFAEVLGDKLSDSSIQDIYTRCRMNLAVDPVNTPAPQFLDLGILTINTKLHYLDPLTRFGRPTDIAYGSTPDHIFEKLQGLETK